jgi:branched-chain amino acid transport system substrate-binding protein
MKRNIWIGIGIVVIVALAIVLVVTQTKREPQEIKIGAVLPLTGDGAKYGEEARNGIELALEDIKDLKIKVVYEDDQGTVNGAINAFNKLVESVKVPIIIGPMYSSTALAVAPLGEKKKVVIFSPSASSPELTKAGDYFFRNWPSDVYEGGEMARFAYNNLNLKTIAILSVNLDYGVGLIKVFEKVFKSLGGQILTIEYYDQGATDFRTQLSKIKSLNPEAIYLPGYYTEIGLILRQAKEMGLKTKFLSCVGFDNPKVLEIAGNAAEGVIFARPYYDPESKNPMVKTFVERFRQRFGRDPGIYAAHSYDALKIVVTAIKKGGYSADGIKSALYSIKNFPGVTGNTSFDENGDVEKPIQIMKVKHGSFVRYE